MIEQITVAEAVRRGNVGWHYAIYTSMGHFPVQVAKADGYYLLTVIGMTEPKAVDGQTTVHALPIVEGRKP